MEYLECNKCHQQYELLPGKKPEDFNLTCDCGGKLEKRDDDEQFFNETDLMYNIDSKNEYNKSVVMKEEDNKPKPELSDDEQFFKEVAPTVTYSVNKKYDKNDIKITKTDIGKLILWLIKVGIFLFIVFINIGLIMACFPIGLFFLLGTAGIYKILFDK
ncbi:MAG: hypothetical protein K8E24_012125 [Methanobacterium paludis]|nr:hypothetical protein [Methanobacterium paludis]